MVTAERARRQRGRKATSSWLRLLAACVALVLTAGALSQAAHFLLVPHVICAEHGELLEVDERAPHAAREHAAATEDRPSASAPEAVAEHEHCQVLLRGQRERALPEAPSAELASLTTGRRAPVFVASDGLRGSLQTLALAPKTSPPSTPSC